MKNVNKWCSFGEKIYRTCKKGEDGFLVKPTFEELMALARQQIGRDVWEVHDLGEGARLSWCAKHNTPLIHKYTITGVSGVDLSGAYWYVRKNEAYPCPLIMFIAESEFADSESGLPHTCTGLRITSDEIFLSMDDVRKHFVKMHRHTCDMYNREYNAIKYDIDKVRDSFGSFVTWFRENGRELRLKKTEMDMGFARLISEVDMTLGMMRKLYQKGSDEGTK